MNIPVQMLSFYMYIFLYQIFPIQVVSCEIYMCKSNVITILGYWVTIFWLLSVPFSFIIYFPSAIFWHGCQPYYYTITSVTDLLVSPFEQLQYLNPYYIKRYNKQCNDLKLWVKNNFNDNTEVIFKNHRENQFAIFKNSYICFLKVHFQENFLSKSPLQKVYDKWNPIWLFFHIKSCISLYQELGLKPRLIQNVMCRNSHTISSVWSHLHVIYIVTVMLMKKNHIKIFFSENIDLNETQLG